MKRRELMMRASALALPAALAYRRKPEDWQELALRVLPLAFDYGLYQVLMAAPLAPA